MTNSRHGIHHSEDIGWFILDCSIVDGFDRSVPLSVELFSFDLHRSRSVRLNFLIVGTWRNDRVYWTTLIILKDILTTIRARTNILTSVAAIAKLHGEQWSIVDSDAVSRNDIQKKLTYSMLSDFTPRSEWTDRSSHLSVEEDVFIELLFVKYHFDCSAYSLDQQWLALVFEWRRLESFPLFCDVRSYGWRRRWRVIE